MCRKMLKTAKFDLKYLWWPDLWPDQKIEQSLSINIFDGLLIAAYRVSLRGPGAQLEGGVKTPPQHDTENTGHQHGAI